MSRAEKRKVRIDGEELGLGESPFASLESSQFAKGKKVSRIPVKKKMAEKVRPKGRVEVRREKSGRGGKTVTTIQKFPSHITLQSLESALFDLKKMCACGGTLKGRSIELQGDVRDQVCGELQRRGFQAVRAGG
jgi:translation initiation factor 1